MRQLRMAIHDARVAFDCIGLGEIERAQTCLITARAAMDAADTVLRHGLASSPAPQVAAEGVAAMAAIAE
ncbi:hypothetical protein [Actinomadura parmotrematis]|uniref:Uncharacterized protein n=1 Tax=Actinomadura parmotrematis TaxID=2864039 RepID=A0ABS7FR63_9ACTN|nr:hypothetical protein [Actinomadura parmotrematis]MBW8482018.1 hypothetical protein [Actinomadura parmotrematis]